MNCYVTLLTNDYYLPGALVLYSSLKETNTTHDINIMVTENVSSTAKKQLKKYYNNVYVISTIKSINTDQLKLLNRLDLDVTYSKLHAFNPVVIPYAKVAFLDADVLVLKNIDEIFEHVGDGKVFGAAPDIGWPDCFNSGVFVAIPSKELFDGLVDQTKVVSFDGGDQGLLNMYFGDWSANSKNTSRLSFTFNVTPTSFYSYLPAYVHFKNNIKVVHFIGTNKPWKQSRTAQGSFLQGYIGFNSDLSEHGMEFLKAWWAIFDRHLIHQNLKEFVLDRDWSRYEAPSQDPLSPFQGLGHTKHHVKLDNNSKGGMDFVNYHVDWNDEELGKLKKLNIHRRPSFEQKSRTPSPTDSISSSKSRKKKRGSSSSVSAEAAIAEEPGTTENYIISSHGTIHYLK